VASARANISVGAVGIGARPNESLGHPDRSSITQARPPVSPSFKALAVLACVAVLYASHLGSWSLGASEAYSALAASQQTLSGVVETTLRFDPGKPPLYPILLHWFMQVFGSGTASLRGFSAICAAVTAIMLYLLAHDMFSADTALSATIIWAFDPVALTLGQWTRMYSLFVCTAVGSLLGLWLLRQKTSRLRLAVFVLCSTMMLYTHMCGLLFAAVEASILIRDCCNGRRVMLPATGLAAAFVLLTPFLPTELAQARDLLLNHWLDWIGPAPAYSKTFKGLIAAVACVVFALLLFRPRLQSDEREPLWFCVMWLVIPPVALAAVSIIVRPAFSLRYVAPVLPVLAILVACALARFGSRFRNLAISSIAVAFAIFGIFCQRVRYEPWADIASSVSTGGAGQEVFFESGLIVSQVMASDRDNDNTRIFPDGYLRIPFDYYYKGSNSRGVIDASRPASTRSLIAAAARGSGGAWLVSGKPETIAHAEMPNSDYFRVVTVLHHEYVTLYHIVPAGTLTPAKRVDDRARNEAKASGE
jgi:uncharacterized membrane protein